MDEIYIGKSAQNLYWSLEQTDLRTGNQCSATIPWATFALKQMFESAACTASATHIGLQNSNVSTGVLNRRTFGPGFFRSATMNSTAFALKRVLERASGVMEGSQNPTLGTSVMNKWTFGLQFHRFATMHCVTFALKRVLECPFSRKCVRYARRIVKPDFR